MYLKLNETDDNSKVFIEQQCSCSLDGETGFCGSMVGTEEHTNYLQNYRTLLANNKCHTMDRMNLKSYLDKCAAASPEIFEKVIKDRFNLTYHPYVQAG
jgi:hypothetical protein